jgi:protein-tyrosine phosphatase
MTASPVQSSFNVDYFVALDDMDLPTEPLPMGYSFVTDQLAQGSAPPPDQKIPFDILVLTASEYQPAFNQNDLQIIRVTLDDSIPSREDIRKAIVAAKQVADALRKGKRVLTTCYMGRNRSGLINGLALIDVGWSSIDAVKAIRIARGDKALSNAYFQSVLHSYAQSLGRTSSAELP